MHYSCQLLPTSLVEEGAQIRGEIEIKDCEAVKKVIAKDDYDFGIPSQY